MGFPWTSHIHFPISNLFTRCCDNILLLGSTQIGIGDFYSFSRQESRENLRPQIFLIPIAVSSPLNHTNLVIQPFDEPQLDLVPWVAVGRDAGPVALDQSGKFLKRPEPLPLEQLMPAGEELTRSVFPAIGQELPELLLQQVGGGQALVGPQQFLERAVTCLRAIGALGEPRVRWPLIKARSLAATRLYSAQRIWPITSARWRRMWNLSNSTYTLGACA